MAKANAADNELLVINEDVEDDEGEDKGGDEGEDDKDDVPFPAANPDAQDFGLGAPPLRRSERVTTQIRRPAGAPVVYVPTRATKKTKTSSSSANPKPTAKPNPPSSGSNNASLPKSSSSSDPPTQQWEPNRVGKGWAVHEAVADLTKSIHTFPNNLPSMVMFDGGSKGLSAATSAVAKHFTSCASANSKHPTMEQPLYVSLTDFQGWLALQGATSRGVPGMAPLVHTNTQKQPGSEADMVENTWIFNRINDEAGRQAWSLPSPLDQKPATLDRLRDARRVLTYMTPLIEGSPLGHSFCTTSDAPTCKGIALAQLVVSRFSREGTTIWDLCKTRPLQALPMAALAMGRNYVCVSGAAPLYDEMVDNMENISFLLGGCASIFDGRWDSNENTNHKLSVMLLRSLVSP